MVEGATGPLLYPTVSDGKLSATLYGQLTISGGPNGDGNLTVNGKEVAVKNRYWHQIKIVPNLEYITGRYTGNLPYGSGYVIFAILDYYSNDETPITTYEQLINIVSQDSTDYETKSTISGIAIANVDGCMGKGIIKHLYKTGSAINYVVQCPFGFSYHLIAEFNEEYYVITDNVSEGYGVTIDIPMTTVKNLYVNVSHDGGTKSIRLPFSIQLPYATTDDDIPTSKQAAEILFRCSYAASQHLITSRIHTDGSTFGNTCVLMINETPTLVVVGTRLGTVTATSEIAVEVEFTNLTTCETTVEYLPIN